MSAHHWHDVPRGARRSAARVEAGGKVCSSISPAPIIRCSTRNQAIEVLRDGSHIRDYRADEWIACSQRRVSRQSIRERGVADRVSSWVARMRTPGAAWAAIRSLWSNAPDEVRQYFDVQEDGSFELDALMIEAS